MKPATPMLSAMIDDMQHGDGIPRCAEWDRLEAFAAQMEQDRAELVAALRRFAGRSDEDVNHFGRADDAEALLAKLGEAA